MPRVRATTSFGGQSSQRRDISPEFQSFMGDSRKGVQTIQEDIPHVGRRHSFSETSTFRAVKRAPVRLYISDKDPCVRSLHVHCHDQVGVLFLLSELLTRHGIDVDTADIAVVGDRVDNRFFLRAPRPSDFANAAEWCRELEQAVLNEDVPGLINGGSCSSSGKPLGDVSPTSAAAAATKLAVNPHLLCVSSFQPVLDGPEDASSAPAPGRKQQRWRLELKGINQAGLLAYISLVLNQSGFSIRRAHISTKDGHVSDEFEVTAMSNDAPRRLQRYLDLPMNTEEDRSVPQLQQLWAGDCSPLTFGSPARRHSTGENEAEDAAAAARAGLARHFTASLSADSKRSGYNFASASPRAPARERLQLPNGDTYEGTLSTDGTHGQQRHGYGVYSYADEKALYLRYSGQWRKNTKHGFGTLLLRDGSAYVGQWQENERHGVGVMFAYGPKGAPGQAAMPTYRYEGEWLHDHPHGIGVEETEEYLYCGRFENGSKHGRGLMCQLRKPGVAGCSALHNSDWQPLTELLAADAAARHSRLQAAHDPAEDLANAPAAQTIHFGASGPGGSTAASHRAGLSSICFTPAEEEHQPNMQASASRPGLAGLCFGEDKEGGGQDVAGIAAAGQEKISSNSAVAHVAAAVARFLTPRPRANPAPELPRMAPDMSSPSAASYGGGSPPHGTGMTESLSAGGQDKNGGSYITLEELPVSHAPTNTIARTFSGAGERPVDRTHSKAKTFSENLKKEAARDVTGAPVVKAKGSPPPRRAKTPEPAQRTAAGAVPAVIACPMLWSEDELATVVGCLGVASSAGERLRGEARFTGGSAGPLRLSGATQLVQMSNAEMSQELGLAAPLERMVVRRALQHLLDADRWANSSRGRGGRDILDDPALRPYVIPLEHLTLQTNISQGGFGVVYKGLLQQPAESAKNGQPRRRDAGRRQVVAVKEMLGDHRVRLYELLKEAHVMASLKHPNICRFIGVCTDGRPKGKRYIVSELLHCSLFDLIHRPNRVPFTGKLDLPLVVFLCEGICAGLAYIHARSLVHADLKSSNILIDLALREEDNYRPVPRICDFGHAAVRISSSPHDRLCTPHWAAPEVLRNEGLGPAADVFSVGVLLWEMLAKKVPHHDLGFGQVLASVGWAGATPDDAYLPAGLPGELRMLLDEFLRFLPSERPSAREGQRRLQRLPRVFRRRALEALLGFVGCGC